MVADKSDPMRGDNNPPVIVPHLPLVPPTDNLACPDKVIIEYTQPASFIDQPMKDICVDVMPVREKWLVENFEKERATAIFVSSESELVKQKYDEKNEKVMIQNKSYEHGDFCCDIPNEDKLSSSILHELHFAHGEASFSATGFSPPLISYSGSIPYSGNISHRSESSTASTRSFAFPILQSDWNSSPVRMAKTRRGYLRKHKRWMQCLVCCRF